MMTLQPKSTSKPSSAVINEAMHLIAVLGGKDKKANDMLQEMRDVQLHNEKVLSEAKDAINALNQKQEKFEKDTLEYRKKVGSFNQAAKEFEAEMDKRSANMHRRESEANVMSDRAHALMKEAEAKASEMAKNSKLQEQDYNERIAKLIKEEDELKQAQSIYTSLKADLDNKIKQLKTIIGG